MDDYDPEVPGTEPPPSLVRRLSRLSHSDTAALLDLAEAGRLVEVNQLLGLGTVVSEEDGDDELSFLPKEESDAISKGNGDEELHATDSAPLCPHDHSSTEWSQSPLQIEHFDSLEDIVGDANILRERSRSFPSFAGSPTSSSPSSPSLQPSGPPPVFGIGVLKGGTFSSSQKSLPDIVEEPEGTLGVEDRRSRVERESANEKGQRSNRRNNRRATTGEVDEQRRRSRSFSRSNTRSGSPARRSHSPPRLNDDAGSADAGRLSSTITFTEMDTNTNSKDSDSESLPLSRSRSPSPVRRARSISGHVLPRLAEEGSLYIAPTNGRDTEESREVSIAVGEATQNSRNNDSLSENVSTSLEEHQTREDSSMVRRCSSITTSERSSEAKGVEIVISSVDLPGNTLSVEMKSD